MPELDPWTDPELVSTALSELDDGLWTTYRDSAIELPYLFFVLARPDRPRGAEVTVVTLPYTEQEVLRMAGPEPGGRVERFVALLGAQIRQLSPGKMRDELAALTRSGEDLVAVAAYLDTAADDQSAPVRTLLAADGHGHAYRLLHAEPQPEAADGAGCEPQIWACVPDLERVGAFEDGEPHGPLLWGLAVLAQTYREVLPPGEL